MAEDALSYQGRVGSYELTMIANSQTIQFHYYQDTQPAVVYEALFFKQLQGSTDPAAARLMLDIFKSFKRLYHYIEEYAEDQQRVSIASAGYFTVTYFKTKIKPKKAPVIEFDGRRLMSEIQLQQEKQVRSEVIDVRAENAFLKETFMRLQLQYQTECNQIQALRQKILMSKKFYLKDLRADAKMLRRDEDWSKREDKKVAIKQLEEAIISIKQTIKDLINQVGEPTQMPQLDQSVQDDYQTLEKYGMKHWVTIDLNNKYLSKHFVVQGNTLRKIGVYFSCQVLGRDPFPTTGRHYYSVFIDKMTASIFSVGIVSQSRRNQQKSVDHEDCIAYFARNGTVWQDRTARGGGPPVPEGVQLRIVVDWVKQMVKWYQDGVEIASTMIGKHLFDKRLVPYIQLNYVNDQVTFNERKTESRGEGGLERAKT